MPKRNTSKRNKHGGWPGSEWFNSLKSKVSSAYSSMSGTPSTYTPSIYTPSSTDSYAPSSTDSYAPSSTDSYTPSSYGGRRRKTIKMRGGYSDNISTTNLAHSASPFSGATARAHSYVGGRKTKRRCNKNKKYRRNCRK